MLGYGLVGAEGKGLSTRRCRQGERKGMGNVVDYDLVGGRDPVGYYLVGGAGYEFIGYE